jgi:hypothetical protein
VGSAVKPPGTYNVKLRCREVVGNALNSQNASLIVWAVAA